MHNCLFINEVILAKSCIQNLTLPLLKVFMMQEEDFIAYMFGFQDSKGAPDIRKAVAELANVEEQLPTTGGGINEKDQSIIAALLARLRFRRNLLNVSFTWHLLCTNRCKQSVEEHGLSSHPRIGTYR